MGSRSLLQGIFSTQGLNPGLLNCKRILYQLSHQGSWHYTRLSLKVIATSEPITHGQLLKKKWPSPGQEKLQTVRLKYTIRVLSKKCWSSWVRNENCGLQWAEQIEWSNSFLSDSLVLEVKSKHGVGRRLGGWKYSDTGCAENQGVDIGCRWAHLGLQYLHGLEIKRSSNPPPSTSQTMTYFMTYWLGKLSKNSIPLSQGKNY